VQDRLRRPNRRRRRLLAAILVVVLAACSSDQGVATTTSAGGARTKTSDGASTSYPMKTTGDTSSATSSTTKPGPCTQAGAIAAWPIEARAAQLVVVPSLDFNIDDLAPIIRTGVGGVLFLGHAPAPADLAVRIARARSGSATAVVPWFMADQEGGGVQRMKGLVDPIPWARTMGATLTPTQIQETAQETGRQLRAAGIDVDLAPVLDVDDAAGPSASNPDGKRSFSGTATGVTASGLAFERGLTNSGVVSVVKHFPGLGHSTANTDMGPASTKSITALRSVDLLPFKAAIDAGAPAVMVANATVPGLTTRPASVSAAAIRGLLRTELGFQGMVMTDSLSAGAITAAGLSLPQAVVAAIEAGADQVLFGSTLDARELALLQPSAVATTTRQIITALVEAVRAKHLPEARLDDAVANVLRVKKVDLCRPGA